MLLIVEYYVLDMAVPGLFRTEQIFYAQIKRGNDNENGNDHYDVIPRPSKKIYKQVMIRQLVRLI